MTTLDDIVAAALAYENTRFRLQGRNLTGIDCCGLLVNSGRDAGLNISDTTQYDRSQFDIVGPDPAGEFFLKFIRAQSDLIEGKSPRHGCIALLRQSIMPMHCGIIDFSEREPMLIHAQIRKGVTRDKWFSGWHLQLIEFRQYRGVTCN
jgi:hypothetical protein